MPCLDWGSEGDGDGDGDSTSPVRPAQVSECKYKVKVCGAWRCDTPLRAGRQRHRQRRQGTFSFFLVVAVPCILKVLGVGGVDGMG